VKGRNTGSSIHVSRQPPATVCKICWLNIYQGDKTVWVISPAPGLAHIECTGQDIDGPQNA
jgi:hypothetical protein